MDGDSRGGAALSICSVTGLPIKYIGISEKLDGLQVFEPKRIADRILGFGDVISIVEKAKNVIDEKKAEEINKKIQTNKFDFEDFKMQIEQIKKIGPLSTIFDMIPGQNSKILKNIKTDDKQIIWTEAIINSMNNKERKKSQILLMAVVD